MGKIFSTLESNRFICICPPPPESDHYIRELLSNKEAIRNLPFFYKGPQGWTPADIKARREMQERQVIEGSGMFTVMKDRSKNCYLGIVGLRAIDWANRAAEMGIIIDPKYQRAGLGLESHLAILSHSFEVMGLHRIEFMTGKDNQPMQAFYQKYGITFEGHRRDVLIVPGKDDKGDFSTEKKDFFTFAAYSILENEWPEIKSKMLAVLNDRKI